MRYLLIVLLLAALAMGPVASHFPASADPNTPPAVTHTPPIAPPPTLLDGIDWDEWLLLDGIDWDEWLMQFLLNLPVPVPIVP
jgi:hypothetical protein